MSEYKITVGLIQEDGISKFNVLQPNGQDLGLQGIRKILMGALALTIRISENDVEAMRETIEYLESEFVNVDSFKDSKKLIKDK